MNQDFLRNLLKGVREGTVSIDEALETLKQLPFLNLGFARIDTHRGIRLGVGEVIFCEGKTLEQIQTIVKHLPEAEMNILATRASREVYKAIRRVTENCRYYETARIVVIRPKELPRVGKIALVSAGTSDLPVAEEAAVTAETLGSSVVRLYDVGVAGIHRLLDYYDTFSSARAVIVVAGMEGALASVVGGLVACPVIAVPTSVGYGASFHGLAALLSMLNSCAPGVSVVNIDNGFGAGYQAHLINLASSRKYN